MTQRHALRAYCLTMVQMLDTSRLDEQEFKHLCRELDDLGRTVLHPFKDPADERFRQQALAELHAYAMGEDISLIALKP